MPLIAALCLAAGTWHARIPAQTFTLRWQHSIEKVEWDEDWSVTGDWLYLSQARIRGFSRDTLRIFRYAEKYTSCS